MNCKNCYKYDVCSFWANHDNPIEKLCDGCEFGIDAGKIIELPCKVGDIVYLVETATNLFDGRVFVITDWKINSNGDNIYRAICEANGRLIPTVFSEKNIGKTVFITREEAEKALEEVKSCQDT